jgi:hypothetical protein
MIKKIRSLTQQCWVTIDGAFGREYDFNHEKHAEVIVNECIATIQAMRDNATLTEDPEFDAGWDLGAEDAISKLKDLLENDEPLKENNYE